MVKKKIKNKNLSKKRNNKSKIKPKLKPKRNKNLNTTKKRKMKGGNGPARINSELINATPPFEKKKSENSREFWSVNSLTIRSLSRFRGMNTVAILCYRLPLDAKEKKFLDKFQSNNLVDHLCQKVCSRDNQEILSNEYLQEDLNKPQKSENKYVMFFLNLHPDDRLGEFGQAIVAHLSFTVAAKKQHYSSLRYLEINADTFSSGQQNEVKRKGRLFKLLKGNPNEVEINTICVSNDTELIPKRTTQEGKVKSAFKTEWFFKVLYHFLVTQLKYIPDKFFLYSINDIDTINAYEKLGFHTKYNQ